MPNLLVQATVYHGKQIVTLGDANMANWMTQQVEAAESIEVDRGSLIEVRKEGLIIKKSDMISLDNDVTDYEICFAYFCCKHYNQRTREARTPSVC